MARAGHRLLDLAAEIALHINEPRYDLGPYKTLSEHPAFPSSSDMSSTLPRTSQRLLSGPAAHSPAQRLAQVRRHLSTSPASKGEIRDAYILSAARTPTGKVLLSLLVFKAFG